MRAAKEERRLVAVNFRRYRCQPSWLSTFFPHTNYRARKSTGFPELFVVPDAYDRDVLGVRREKRCDASCLLRLWRGCTELILGDFGGPWILVPRTRGSRS